jgi:hypothetical protein
MSEASPIAQWATKYVFRLVHIATFACVTAEVFSQYFTRDTIHHTTFQLAAKMSGPSMIFSGFVNMILLRAWELTGHTRLFGFWKQILLLKTVLAVALFSPVKKYLPMDQSMLKDAQFWVWWFMIIVSPLARYIREYAMETVLVIKTNETRKLS